MAAHALLALDYDDCDSDSLCTCIGTPAATNTVAQFDQVVMANIALFLNYFEFLSLQMTCRRFRSLPRPRHVSLSLLNRTATQFQRVLRRFLYRQYLDLTVHHPRCCTNCRHLVDITQSGSYQSFARSDHCICQDCGEIFCGRCYEMVVLLWCHHNSSDLMYCVDCLECKSDSESDSDSTNTDLTDVEVYKRAMIKNKQSFAFQRVLLDMVISDSDSSNTPAVTSIVARLDIVVVVNIASFLDYCAMESLWMTCRAFNKVKPPGDLVLLVASEAAKIQAFWRDHLNDEYGTCDVCYQTMFGCQDTDFACDRCKDAFCGRRHCFVGITYDYVQYDNGHIARSDDDDFDGYGITNTCQQVDSWSRTFCQECEENLTPLNQTDSDSDTSSDTIDIPVHCSDPEVIDL